MEAEEVAVGGEPQAIVELHAEDKKDAAHRHACLGLGLGLGLGFGLGLG